MTAKFGSSGLLRGGFLLTVAAFAGCVTTFRTASASPGVDTGGGSYVGASVDAFYEALSPYGEWVYVTRLGRVWRPNRVIVGADFRPYLTAGHWVYTDYGWTFESDYDWGWAPYHYGRWYMDPFYGWVWTPDTVWGPAWVDWRFGGGYVGWVPLPPPSISVSFNYYQPSWCFVPVHHFVVHDVDRHALPMGEFHSAYSITTPVREQVHHAGARWNAGPPPGQVSQVVGQPIQRVNIAPPPPGRIEQVHPGRTAGATPQFGAAAAQTQVRSSPAPNGEAHWGRPPQAAPLNRNEPHWGRTTPAQPLGSAPGATTPPPGRVEQLHPGIGARTAEPTWQHSPPAQAPHPMQMPPAARVHPTAPPPPSPGQVSRPVPIAPSPGAHAAASPAPPAAPAPRFHAPPAGRAAQQNQ
jgi:hypothetical protein